MKVLRRIATLLGAAAIAAGVLLVSLTGAANAEPSGCASHEQGSTSSDGHLISHATASCSTAHSLDLAATVRQDISFYPDRQVGRNDTGTHAYYNYNVTESTCDAGRTETYFGLGFFTTHTTEHGSPHTKQHSCPR